ncbi:macro domain-containing protein [Fusobacterium varium]|uniref:macro domain-containing protein n=1 Tax=Fusobacterium varium TaxID=856 RepID=UPI001F3434D8|nr:macro domain-containing protein [Fusobacterium varium]MCF2673383.1 macro domain-containing protein [Fusobacterium varium]
MKINLVILDREKYIKAKTYIKNKNFNIVLGNLLEQKGDLVTAGNSFGFMDGGLDLEFIKKYGWKLQEKVQKLIKNRPLKELLVGENIIVDLEENKKLIYAPTMRIPSILEDNNINIYLAFKGILVTCKSLNIKKINIKEINIKEINIKEINIKEINIKEINIPLLGEGVGQMSIHIIIKQMEQAYMDLVEDYYPENWWESSKMHQLLYTEIDKIKDLQY